MRVWVIAIVAALIIAGGITVAVVSMRTPGTAPQTIPPDEKSR
jgi:hypothetical protein